MKIVLASLLPLSASAAAGVYSYDPENEYGPDSWAKVDVPDNQCGGSSQSGIDVPTSGCNEYADYTLTPGSCTLADMGYQLMPHVIQGNYPEGACTPPRMTIPNQPNPFDGLQFHIHTGSDHAIDGTYFGADLHLVHAEVGGDRYSVLGFFLEPTSPNPTSFGALLDQFEAVAEATAIQCSENGPTNATTAVQSVDEDGFRYLTELGPGRKLQGSFDVYSLMPEGASMYQYDGSLTTPPCSEVVFWNVVDTPVAISVREYTRLINLILDYQDPTTCEYVSIAAPSGFTGRPTMPINGRTINRVCPTSTEGILPSADEVAAASSASSIKMVGVAAALGVAAMLV